MKKRALLFCFSCLFCFPVTASLIDSGVTVEDLSSFSLNTLGYHDKLGKDLWVQSDKETLFPLIDKIGQTPLTPASRNALIFALTQDSTGFEIKEEETSLFLIKRLKALERMGAFQEALDLIELVPSQNLTQDLLLLKTNLLLAKGDFETAQKVIEDLSPSKKTDEAQINLFLETEEKNKAVLSYEIYRENQENSDTLFSALAENVLLELETKIKKEEPFELSHAFLLARLKNVDINEKKLTEGVKKTLLQLPTVDISKRIKYSETTSLDVKELKNIYELPLFDLKTDENHLRRAEIYQKIKSLTNISEKAEWLKTLIKIAMDDKVILHLAPLIEEELNLLLPQPEYKDLAFYATKIYILSNNLEKAYVWYQILANEKEDKYQKERLLLIPLLNKLGAGIPSETTSLLTHFCADATKEDCPLFWKHASNEFYTLQNVTVPPQSVLGIFDYFKQENTAKRGENLIRAVLDLNNREIQDKKSPLFFIKENYLKEISLPLELEGTIE